MRMLSERRRVTDAQPSCSQGIQAGPRFLLAVDTFPQNPWERDRLPAIRKALIHRNHDFMDIYEFHSLDEAHDVHRTKARNYFSKQNLDDLNKKFYEKVCSFGCNILVLGTVDNYSNFLFYETVKKLRDHGIFVVGILGDDEFTSDRNRLYLPMFDKAVAYVASSVNYYNSLIDNCCYYLPSSCHFETDYLSELNLDEEEKLHDVSFFGAPFGPRPALIEALVEHGIRVSLFGSPKWLEYEKLRGCYRGFVATSEFDWHIRRSQIVLAFLEDHLTGALHMNTKIWEAVRNCQFPIATRYAALANDYGLVEDEDIVMYETSVDLAEKVEYYLKNPYERRRIALNLHNKIKNNFAYDKLYDNLFTLIENDYAQKETNPTYTNLPQSVTIIDRSPSGRNYEGFPVVRLPKSRKWRTDLLKNYKNLIKTPFVIVSHGAYFSPYLQTLLHLFPDLLVNGKSLLLDMSLHNHLRVFPISDSIVWEKNTFAKEVLNSDAVDIDINPVLHCFHNLRLCAHDNDNLLIRILEKLYSLYISFREALSLK